MKRRVLLASVVAYGALAASASAQPNDENDILLCSVAASPNDLATGLVDTIAGGITVPQRIFLESVDGSAGVDDLRGDEGFFSVSDAELLPDGYLPPPAGADIRFDFRAFAIAGQAANLWFWDPVADPAMHFVPASDGQSLTFQKSPVQFFHATVDGAAADVPGFVIDRTSPGGALHRHLTMVVDDGDADPGTPVPAGVYVAAYVLSHAGGAAPLVIEVINGGMGPAGDAAMQQAFAFFTDYLSPCSGDVNGSGQVDLNDLTILLAHFGTASGAAGSDGDLDGDGDVDLSDLTELLSAFGLSC